MKTHKKYIIAILLIIPCICFIHLVQFRLAAMGPIDIMLVELQDYNQRNMHTEMATAYERLVQKYPERTALQYPLGWAYYKIGRLHKAYACMQKYMAGNPYYPAWRSRYITLVEEAVHNAI